MGRTNSNLYWLCGCAGRAVSLRAVPEFLSIDEDSVDCIYQNQNYSFCMGKTDSYCMRGKHIPFVWGRNHIPILWRENIFLSYKRKTDSYCMREKHIPIVWGENIFLFYEGITFLLYEGKTCMCVSFPNFKFSLMRLVCWNSYAKGFFTYMTCTRAPSLSPLSGKVRRISNTPGSEWISFFFKFHFSIHAKFYWIS